MMGKRLKDSGNRKPTPAEIATVISQVSLRAHSGTTHETTTIGRVLQAAISRGQEPDGNVFDEVMGSIAYMEQVLKDMRADVQRAAD